MQILPSRANRGHPQTLTGRAEKSPLDEHPKGFFIEPVRRHVARLPDLPLLGAPSRFYSPPSMSRIVSSRFACFVTASSMKSLLTANTAEALPATWLFR